jgi:serine/threonine protein kinase
MALEHLHQEEVIHGDVKPENILIDLDGYFQLADFSSAQYYNCSST